jgi:hypothetical protein
MSFNSRDSKRIARKTRRDETTPMFRVNNAPRPRLQWMGKLGLVTSGGISARSGTALGSGSVDLQFLDASGVYSSASITVTVYSMFSTSIASTTLVKLGLVDGQYVVDTVAC